LLKEGCQFAEIVFPPLVVPRFKHRESAILHACIGQCRDEALSLLLVLVIQLLQNGSKGLHKRMILNSWTAYLLINHAPPLRNTTAPCNMWENKCGVCRENDTSDEFRRIWHLLPHQAPTVIKLCRNHGHFDHHDDVCVCGGYRPMPHVCSCRVIQLTDTDCLPRLRQDACSGRVAYQPEQTLRCHS
jgi:hypothetical protein